MVNQYAGVGIRKVTPIQLHKCYRIGNYMARHGWTLHTGLAEGADRQFCLGALEAHDKRSRVILHSPFQAYAQDWSSMILKQFKDMVEVQVLDPDDQQAFQMVQQYHPAWEQLSSLARLFHACNYRIRVPQNSTPVLLTIALQGDRPPEQEFGYILNQGLSIPSILIRDLASTELKSQLAHYVEQPENAPPEGIKVELECWSKQDRSVKTDQDQSKSTLQGDPTYLLPVVRCIESTLWEQASELKRKFKEQEAATCPCCGQSVNLRHTTISPKIARWLVHLIRIYLENGRDWVVCSKYPELSATKGGDYSKSKHWGLIESKTTTKSSCKGSTNRGSGVWRPTAKGIAYVLGQIRIPRSCLTYNDMVYSYSSVETLITEEVLDDPTEYSRLIDGLEKSAYPEA